MNRRPDLYGSSSSYLGTNSMSGAGKLASSGFQPSFNKSYSNSSKIGSMITSTGASGKPTSLNSNYSQSELSRPGRVPSRQASRQEEEKKSSYSYGRTNPITGTT